MEIHIDLSNRLEESGPTYVACANHTTYVIKVPFQVKQFGLQLLALKRTPKKQRRPLLWAACLYLVLQQHLKKAVKEPCRIFIDNEFDTYQIMIKRDLLAFIR
ncbi:MAG: hypothetical protein AAF485_20915, partial [Chloroflexota bacterium]